ncbi:MAG: hypothetical protein IT457_23385 [Planctomycetes bacterium]|nr:hypothetical protein [Planctomycetota bacterium]
MAAKSFRQLDPERVIATIARLRDRIRERFPAASLAELADELLSVARDHARRSERIRRASPLLRALCGMLVLAAVAALVLAVATVHPRLGDDWPWSEVIQSLEAALGALFFLGAGVVFVMSLESRARRRRCLEAIHEMRAMAHIVDMHQLTKDPERIGDRSRDTESSPRRELDAFALSRYLDYCSEILSLIGKLAALYVQGFHDPVAIEAVDDVEDLTNGLSRKIWQKITFLDARSRT